MEEIITRDFLWSEDEAFVFDSWLSSYFGHSPFTCFIPKYEFLVRHRCLIQDLLKESTTKMLVKADDPSLIVGYICFHKDRRMVHYVYVKEKFRRMGICTKLLFENGFFNETRVTHLTNQGRVVALKRGFIYSPYFL